MIATLRIPALPDTIPAPPEDRMAQQAADSLHFLLINLLPGQTVTQTNTAAFTLGRTGTRSLIAPMSISWTSPTAGWWGLRR